MAWWRKLTTDDIILPLSFWKWLFFQSLFFVFKRNFNWSNFPLNFKNYSSSRIFFWQNYFTFKILPKHLWKDIPIENFVLSDLNLKPIGSGPFKFQKSIMDKNNRITQINLVYFNDYFEGRHILIILFLNFPRFQFSFI